MSDTKEITPEAICDAVTVKLTDKSFGDAFKNNTRMPVRLRSKSRTPPSILRVGIAFGQDTQPQQVGQPLRIAEVIAILDPLVLLKKGDKFIFLVQRVFAVLILGGYERGTEINSLLRRCGTVTCY